MNFISLHAHGHSGASPVRSWEKLTVRDRSFIRGGKGWAGANEEGVIGILRRHISGTPTRRTRVEIFWMSRDSRTSVSPSVLPSVRPSVTSVRPLRTYVRTYVRTKAAFANS